LTKDNLLVELNSRLTAEIRRYHCCFVFGKSRLRNSALMMSSVVFISIPRQMLR